MQANADVGKDLAGAAVEIERGVNIVAGFHVNPDHAFGASILDDFCEVAIAQLQIEVEAQLSQLDGDFSAQAHHPYALQHLQIVCGNLFRLVGVGDVLAQAGENATN